MSLVQKLQLYYQKTTAEYGKLFQVLLKPDEYCQKVEDIDLDALLDKGYDTLFLDLDNTILPYEKKDLSIQKDRWLQILKSKGFRIFIVSNNSDYRRLNRICKDTQIVGTWFSLKPFPMIAEQLIQSHYVDMHKTVMVGDQLLTDILFGNFLGSYTVLVCPIKSEESVLKIIQRNFESWALRQFRLS